MSCDSLCSLSPDLHPSEEHLKADYITTLREVCPGLNPPDAPSSPVSGGCTATILRGLTYPKILCTAKKEERKREHGDNAWRRSSPSWAWAAERVKHLVTQSGKAPKARPLTRSLKDSPSKTTKVLQRTQTLN